MTDLMNPFALQPTERVLVCPGCERWQLHYDLDVALQWARYSMSSTGTIANPGLDFDLSDFDEVVEAILREHVAHECPHPRLILELLKGGGKLTL